MGVGLGVLEGKVCLVTGGGRGIGREVVLAMAKAGAALVVNDLGASLGGEGHDLAPAQAVAKEIAALGGKAAANTDSVTDPAGARRMVAQAVESFGRLDAVVNVAGILRDAMFHKMEEAQWRAVIDVHLNGSYFVSRAAVEQFRKQQAGSFVHFTSTSGLVGNIGQANYAAAKMGIVGLSRSIALEGQRYGVRSNCVSPFAWTRMVEAIPVQSEAQLRAFEKFRANATAAQVAPLVVYLASEAAKAVSGQVFGVRGNEIYLMSQPRPIRTLHRGDGWTPERLAETLVPALGRELYPLEGTNEYFAWDPI